jgi:Spy/CpxP family protein refolding chaperone
VKPNRQTGAVETTARAGALDPVHAALRAADEIAAALQAHLTQEHGVHVEDRSQAVAPTLDLLRHARERIAAGLRDAKTQGPLSGG